MIFLRPLFAGRDRELLVALCLSESLRLRRCIRVPGGHDRCTVPISRILSGAMLGRATALVIAHNHPSLDPRPSEGDRITTRQLARACQDIGIRLADHLVIGGDEFTSFRDLGVL